MNNVCNYIKNMRFIISNFDCIVNDKYKYERNYRIACYCTKILRITNSDIIRKGLDEAFVELKKLINLCIFLIETYNIKKTVIYLNLDSLENKNFIRLLDIIKFSGVLNRFEFCIYTNDLIELTNIKQIKDNLSKEYRDIKFRYLIDLSSSLINEIPTFDKDFEFFSKNKIERKPFLKWLITNIKTGKISKNNFGYILNYENDLLDVEEYKIPTYNDLDNDFIKDLTRILKND